MPSKIESPQFLQLEKDLDKKIGDWKEKDKNVYAMDKKRYGGRYLDNKETIQKTKLYRLAAKAPKGGHLHIHFNSCLGPDVLLKIATEKEVTNMMYISTDIQGRLTADKLKTARIKFHFMTSWKNPKSVFEEGYKGRTDANERPPPGTFDRMLFSKFRQEFESKFPGIKVMEWLQEKLVFSSNDVKYNVGGDEASEAQWNIFDTRTQMMAGLFNYEHAYRKYTRLLLDSFQAQNIQYAEIRPNFMEKNQVYKHDKPDETMNNFGIMDCIIDEYTKWKTKNPNSSFGGLKVIYCTPRAFNNKAMQFALDECLKMKKDSRYSRYIAGFDIIGREDRPNWLSFFKEQLQAFQNSCKREGINCPFLFHAGESHKDPHGNLKVALELNAKRIAHGYAIPNNGAVLKECETRGNAKKLCVECCPISNEILGLHPYVKDAVVYTLMDKNIPCALASDNPTLFSSMLSHDFYQFMVGKRNFKIQDWRQLMEDSLKHAVWNDDQERSRVVGIWENNYFKFVNGALSDPDFLKPPQAAGSAISKRIPSSQGATHGVSPVKPTTKPTQNQNAARAAPETAHAPTSRQANDSAHPGKSSSTTTTTTGASRGLARPVGTQTPRQGSGSTTANTSKVATSSARPSASTSTTHMGKPTAGQPRRVQGT